jgi:hypothetical protein
MEVKEVDIVANKADYAAVCIYIKQIESIGLTQLYRALTSYLSFLILPKAEQYLDIYQTHLSDPYSWLSKAECISQAETKREFAKTQAQAAASALDQALWDDSAKKLNYLIESWDADIYTACQQIIHGISMLINEHIPLPEVQSEIIDFAEGRGVFPPVILDEENIAQKLDRLRCDAKVNSSNVLVKLARTVTVQAELFLNRLSQAATPFDRLDVRQIFLFEANYKLCEFIETQSKALKGSLSTFPTKLAQRVAKKLDRIEVDAVMQRYESYAPSSLKTQEETFDEERFYDEKNALEHIDEMLTADESLHETAPEKTSVLSSAGVTHEKLEKMLTAREQLLETVIKQVSLHRLQLLCSSRVKACYGKFTLFPLFRQIATKLAQYQATLIDSLAELTDFNEIVEVTEEWSQKLAAITQALENNLSRVRTYLDTLNVHHADYSVIDEVSGWQSKLHDLILYSSEEELAVVDSRLQRIEVMDSPYLRATLVMKLDVAKMKLNDMIIANMQSWSSRLVDRDTVVNTLRYLGIHVHPSHLNKIAPNIRVAKKKILSKKDLYSTAADYSMTAWKKLRTWLDKQMIN